MVRVVLSLIWATAVISEPSIILILAFCFLASAGIVAGLVWVNRMLARTPGPVTDKVSFLFEDGVLVDQSRAAREWLKAGTVLDCALLDDVTTTLEADYPGLGAKLGKMGRDGDAKVWAATGPSFVRITSWESFVRLCIEGDDSAQVTLHSETLAAMDRELAILKSVSMDPRVAIWRTDRTGKTLWVSDTFAALAGRFDNGTNDVWPPEPDLARAEPDPIQIAMKDDKGALVALELRWENWPDGRLFIATDRTEAEETKALSKSFVATLSRTFAELTVGLAIFNSDRQLVVFNPALTDLTGLSASFLARKPLFGQVLDRLRSSQMLPEPKNYRSWRQQLTDIEGAAKRGTYSELWPIPDGRTFRVIGRPHPEGSIAILIEDISADLALTRRYRAQFDATQGMLDSISTGMAVFSKSGTLKITNQAYCDGWGSSALTLSDVRLPDEIAVWQSQCAPNPIWHTAETDILSTTREGGVDTELRLRDGRGARLRSELIGTGDILIKLDVVQHNEDSGDHVQEMAPVEATGT